MGSFNVSIEFVPHTIAKHYTMLFINSADL